MSSSSSASSEYVPLVEATTVVATENDHAIARALTQAELIEEQRKGTRIVHAEAWDDYYSGRDRTYYGSWQNPDGRRVVVYRDEDDIPPGLLFCW